MEKQEFLSGEPFIFEGQDLQFVKEEADPFPYGYIFRIWATNNDTIICSVSHVGDSGFAFFQTVLNKKVHGYIPFSECYTANNLTNANTPTAQK